MESSERGVALYDIEQHRRQALLFSGHDPAVCGLGTIALSRWALGFPDQAIASSQEALALAGELDHPASLVQALGEAAEIRVLRGEPRLVREQTESLMPITIEQGFTDKVATATFLLGWARLAEGETAAGLEEMERGLSLRGRWAEIEEPLYLSLVIEAYRRAGQYDKGRHALATALATADRSGVRYWDAELHRLEGDLLVARGEPTRAEASYRRALEIARQRSAKSLELRAATGLAELWSGQGRGGPRGTSWRRSTTGSRRASRPRI